MKQLPDTLHRCSTRFGLLQVLIIVAAMRPTAGESPEPPLQPAAPDAVTLQPAALTESSGLAASGRRPDRFWIHNDSGDGAVLYAVNGIGCGTGRWQVKGADAVDWEDMASLTLDGRPHLLIADVGDNGASRRSVSLYLVEEPDPDGEGQVPFSRRIDVTYPDGPRDCEAVAVDQIGRQIVLVAKTAWPAAGVYAVPLDAPVGAPEMVVARRLTQVPMPMVTAMDVRDEDGAILLGGYFDGFLYRKRSDDASVAETLGGSPQHIVWPRLRQIEGACFDRGGQLWVCSEGSPGHLARVADAAVPATDFGPDTTSPFEAPPQDGNSPCSKSN